MTTLSNQKTIHQNPTGVHTDRPVSGTDFPGRMLNACEAARYLGVSASWMAKRRVYGGGPGYSKFGRRVTYSVADLDDFATRNRRQNTSEVSTD
jgi:hypothetical protein